jgi:hypothetical protein
MHLDSFIIPGLALKASVNFLGKVAVILRSRQGETDTLAGGGTFLGLREPVRPGKALLLTLAGRVPLSPLTLVAIRFGFKWSLNLHTNVMGLLWSKFGEDPTKSPNHMGRNFFIQNFWKHLDVGLFRVRSIRKLLFEQINLGQDLIGKRSIHHS